jgi:hypothetical protein
MELNPMYHSKQESQYADIGVVAKVVRINPETMRVNSMYAPVNQNTEPSYAHLNNTDYELEPPNNTDYYEVGPPEESLNGDNPFNNLTSYGTANISQQSLYGEPLTKPDDGNKPRYMTMGGINRKPVAKPNDDITYAVMHPPRVLGS